MIAATTTRAAVFAHFDRDDRVDDYVVHYVAALCEIAATVVVVSTACLPAEEIHKLASLGARVILRDNVGYDFMSYKMGLHALRDHRCDEVVLCNDSVYGPLSPLAALFAAMQTRPCDFWGLTGSYEGAFHAQSYFLVFRKAALQHPHFTAFWDGLAMQRSKADVIREHEIGLTRQLIAGGLACATYIPTALSLSQRCRFLAWKTARRNPLTTVLRKLTGSKKKTISRQPNLVQWRAAELIRRHQFPFVKIELLRDNPLDIPLRPVIEVITATGYRMAWIAQHLARVTGAPPQH